MTKWEEPAEGASSSGPLMPAADIAGASGMSPRCDPREEFTGP